MKRAIAIFFLVLFTVAGYSCKKDIIIVPPNEIIGHYTGAYKVVRNVPTGTQTKLAQIQWSFQDGSHYAYDSVETVQGNTLCPSFGTYSLAERITFVNAQNPPPCTGDERDYPDGDFVLQRLITQNGSDSLYMLQVVTDPDTGWTKEIFLRRDTVATD